MISRKPTTSSSLFLIIVSFVALLQAAFSQDHSATFEVQILSTKFLPSPTSINICLKHFQRIFIPTEKCVFGNQTLQYPSSSKNGTSFNFFEKLPDDFTLAISFIHPTTEEFLVQSITGILNPTEKWTQKSIYFHPKNLQKSSPPEILIKYRIQCTANHFGKSCSKICVPPADSSYTCSPLSGDRICQPGFFGSECTKKCLCKNGICAFNGTCKCSPGWMGSNCDQCIPLKGCQGSCSIPSECKCPPGFKGKFCNESIFGCLGFCKNGGTCSLTTKNYTSVCQCPPGFSGQRCEKRASSCHENPCQNNGKCKTDNTSLSGFTCECHGNFAGQFCQREAKTCHDSPCQNGAPCLDGSDGYFCECTNNWEGKICDIPLTFCRADSCLNGAECEYAPSTARGFTCKCAPGFYGEKCENKISDWKVCKNFKCHNHGTCYRSFGRPACQCGPGFAGLQCEKDLCQCLNGGICDRATGTSHKCICPEGFEGQKCQNQTASFSRASRIASLQDPAKTNSESHGTSAILPIIGVILAFILFSILTTFLPKYLKLKRSNGSRQSPSSEMPPSNRKEFKQLELYQLPTTTPKILTTNSFCSSAPPECCRHHNVEDCRCPISFRRSAPVENQYSLDPTLLRPRPMTPEPLREAARIYSSKNLTTASPLNSTSSSNDYEDIEVSNSSV